MMCYCCKGRKAVGFYVWFKDFDVPIEMCRTCVRRFGNNGVKLTKVKVN